MDYHKITLYVKPDKVDVVSATLYDFDVLGVEVVDTSITEAELAEMFADVCDDESITYHLEQSKGKETDETPIHFYLPLETDLNQVMPRIREALEGLNQIDPIGSMELAFDQSLEDDWAHNWKKFYKPFMTCGHILIKPIWISEEEARGQIGEVSDACDLVVDVDPGLAFGSGTHETTSMCIEAIDKYMNIGDSVIDIGCGSGILGIVAAKLGAKEGVLIDLDERACQIASENLVTNQVNDQLEVIHGDLLDKVSSKAELIVANIFADIILMVSGDAVSLLKDNGHFICSGIMHTREDEVIKRLEELGLTIEEVIRKGDWVCIISLLKQAG
jgi:ribosomal protein L11 methyltransferase